MIIVRIIHTQVLIPNRQFISTDQLETIGVDAFSINAIGAPPFRIPLQFSAPTIFIYVSGSYTCFFTAMAFKIPLIKDGNAVLDCNVSEIVTVYIQPVLII